jgi:hypothetical protein
MRHVEINLGKRQRSVREALGDVFETQRRHQWLSPGRVGISPTSVVAPRRAAGRRDAAPPRALSFVIIIP